MPDAPSTNGVGSVLQKAFVDEMVGELQKRGERLSGLLQGTINPEHAPRWTDALGLQNLRDMQPGRIVGSVLEMQRTWLMNVSRMLRNADRAFRYDRTLQRGMMRDPDVLGPLSRLQYGVALLPWSIVPQNEDDELQVQQAAQLQRIIENNQPGMVYWLRSLMDAAWYGPSLVNNIYQQVQDLAPPEPAGDDEYAEDVISGAMGEQPAKRRRAGKVSMGYGPTSWIPIHSDSIAFNEEGAIGIKVGPRFPGAITIGPESWVHMLTPQERAACSLHVVNRCGADYEEPFDAAFIYAGRGLRDGVYEYWHMKQTALQSWLAWCERHGVGLRVGKYPTSDRNGKRVMESIMRNWITDSAAIIPQNATQSGMADYGLELLEGSVTGAVAFLDMVEYLTGKCKELIEGQSATTEGISTGMGSGVAEQHRITFQDIKRYHALGLNDSLSRDFVYQLHLMNFGETPWRPRWRSAVDDVDPKEHMDAVEKFINLGGQVGETHVRQTLGIPDIREGEIVLERQQPDMGDDLAPGGGGGGGFGGFSRGARLAEQFRRQLAPKGRGGRTPGRRQRLR